MEFWTLIKSQVSVIVIVVILGTLGYLHFNREENKYQRFQKYTVVLMCVAILGINFWFAWKWQQSRKDVVKRTSESSVSK